MDILPTCLWHMFLWSYVAHVDVCCQSTSQPVSLLVSPVSCLLSPVYISYLPTYLPISYSA